jgi:RNA polymerase sigma-70 factor (ECF subfamily)
MQNTHQPIVSAEEIEAEWEEIQVAQQDASSFRPLYNRYFNAIFHFIHNRTQDEQCSADLTAQVFLKALQQLDKFKYRGLPFSAWLYRIASNEVGMHYRKSRKAKVISVEDSQLANMVDSIESDQYENYRPYLLSALQMLREEDIQMMELRFFEQRSFREIADIQGITEANARVKAHRVLERLRKFLLLSISKNAPAGSTLLGEIS